MTSLEERITKLKAAIEADLAERKRLAEWFKANRHRCERVVRDEQGRIVFTEPGTVYTGKTTRKES